ncbi:MAG: sulfur carrier protein ThiS [Alphaproteobacteria bacterium]|jgi:thiamine biosynthesis protein ThiS
MSSISASALQITVNGTARTCANLSSVRDLVSELALDPRKIAIEQNGRIIPRSAYDTTVITAGDAIEIVNFVGGG